MHGGGHGERTAPPIHDADFVVPGERDAPPRPLDRVVRERMGLSWDVVRRLVRTGKVRVDEVLVTDPTTSVVAKSSVSVRMASPKPSTLLAIAPSDLIYVDAHVVVVRKPSGISTVRHPNDPLKPEPLEDVVRALLRKSSRGGMAPLGVVQRLDKETSGLLVFTRNIAAREALRRQFRSHSVHRRYVALAQGSVGDRTFVSRLVQNRGDGIRGSTSNPKLGRGAITHIRVIEALAGATLLECALETGRTHQIRIHLSEAGHPIVGDRVYVRDYPGPLIAARRLMLHAAELGFLHPYDGRRMDFVEPIPNDMAALIAELRRK